MNPTVLQSDYSRGIIQDLARHGLPKNAVWRLLDYLPNHGGAPLQKRGGWQDASPSLGTGLIQNIAFAPFAAGNQLLAMAPTTNVLYRIVDAETAVSTGGTFWQMLQRPVFFNNMLISIAPTGVNSAVYYNGSTIQLLASGAPFGRYGAAYKSRFLLGNSAANPNRVWFSDILDAGGWDTANSYVDMTFPVKGFAALRNAIMVFSDGATERIRGDSPPPGGDMVREPIFQEGCIDARSIVTMGERVIWANGNGVWISDGAAADNLVEIGGILQYWTNLLEGYNELTWTIAGGTINGNYVVSVMNGEIEQGTLMVNLQSKTWTFLSNVNACMFAESYGTEPELYTAQRDRARVGKMSSIFDPGSINTHDGDGAAVQPVIETAFYRGGNPVSRRFKDLIVGNAIAAPLDGSTYLKVSYIRSPDDLTYTVLTADDGVTPLKILPTSTDLDNAYQRSKMPARLASVGLGLKIEQVGPSTSTMLFDLEATEHAREGLR